MYRLISSDLDLTLIDDTYMLPSANAEAVSKTIASGLHFVVNSGRSSNSILPYEEKLGLIREGGYGISFNGSVVYETASRHKIRDVRLGNIFAFEILGTVSESGECGVAYVDNDMYVLKQHNELVSSYVNRVTTPVHVIERFEHVEGEITKVLVAAKPEVLIPLQSEIDGRAAGRFSSTLTAPFLLEFMSNEAGKGKALAFLAEYLGISMAETIAIGDFFNDISALKVAGLPVAVANADAELKKIAMYITARPCHEGAVAEVIEKFILGEEQTRGALSI